MEMRYLDQDNKLNKARYESLSRLEVGSYQTIHELQYANEILANPYVKRGFGHDLTVTI